MIFTSYIPALDMLIIPLDPLSKPVGPIFKDHFVGVPLNRVGLSWLHGSLLNPSRLQFSPSFIAQGQQRYAKNATFAFRFIKSKTIPNASNLRYNQRT